MYGRYNVITAVKNDLKNNYYRWGTHSYRVGRFGFSPYWQVGMEQQHMSTHMHACKADGRLAGTQGSTINH